MKPSLMIGDYFKTETCIDNSALFEVLEIIGPCLCDYYTYRSADSDLEITPEHWHINAKNNNPDHYHFNYYVESCGIIHHIHDKNQTITVIGHRKKRQLELF